MSQRSIGFLICSVAALLLSLSISTVMRAQDSGHPASNLLIPKSHLTDEEFDQAVKIGTRGPIITSFVCGPDLQRCFMFLEKSPEETTVLSSVESVDDNNTESRLAIVTTYNYTRNETTRRLVDLDRSEVVDEQTTKGSSAPLAEVETEVAKALVLNDPRIAKFLGPDMDGVEVEILLTGTQNSEDKFYGKRVVLALLKTSRGYPQSLPQIFVNLTDSEVVILE